MYFVDAYVGLDIGVWCKATLEYHFNDRLGRVSDTHDTTVEWYYFTYLSHYKSLHLDNDSLIKFLREFKFEFSDIFIKSNIRFKLNSKRVTFS